MVRLLLPALAALLALAAPAAAEEVPEGYAYSHAWFQTHDGVQMHAGVFLPADRTPEERHPTLVTITPYASPNGGASAIANTTGPIVRFRELFDQAKILEDRWAYVDIDVRGFGGSGGCFEYYGPNEFLDSKVAVEWAASQPWSTGKVGMWGKSYDAAQEVLALGSRPRGLSAAVIQAPGLSGYTGLWHHRVHYATGRYATTGVYTADDLGPPQNVDTLASAEYALAAVSGLTAPPHCRTDALVGMNTERNRDSDFWKAREPYRAAAGSTVPVLWSHGFADANTKPVHLDIWTSLKGTRQAWFGQYTHLRGHEAGVGREGFLDEAFRFLDRHVRGVSTPESDPPVTVQQGNGAGRWRAEEAWPPADSATWSMSLRLGAYADEPGNTAGAGLGHWSVTAPLPHAAHLAGEPVLRAHLNTVVPDANVVALVYDIDPDGTAHFVTRGALAAPAAGPQEVSFTLYPQDWLFERGHRIAVVLSGSDDDWYSPGISGTQVLVESGALQLPLLRYFRDAFLEGRESDGMIEVPPFPTAPELLAEAQVGGELPAPRESRPQPPATSSVTPPAVARRRASLRVRLTGRGSRRKIRVSGRAPGARRVKLELRFGGVRLHRRTVRVRRGSFRANFPAGRLRSGRVEVRARVGKRVMRASVRLRTRRH